MKTILFQGDSITDAARDRDDDRYMGAGYATMTAGKIGINHPGKYRCLNKGISGNRSIDLMARIKSDIIHLKPDVLTILIGVNDTWHELARQDGVSTQKYEILYDMLIQEVKEALPEVKIVILEPFVLCGSGTEAYYDAFAADVACRRQICKKLAEKYALPFVPLQKKLEEFAAKCSTEYVLYDGVHPTFAGHALISEALYETLEPML